MNPQKHYDLGDSMFLCSAAGSCPTPWTAAHQASLSITNPQSSLKLMSINSVMRSNHLILCCPVLFLPSVFPSIRVFSSESVLCIMWPKYWSFSISPSNEYSGLISFRIDWFDLIAVQVTQESSPASQLKASILQSSAFFILQLSHPYMTTGKTIALNRLTFVGKIMSLFFNMLSRLVMWRMKWQPTAVFLPRESCGQRSLVGCCSWDHTESDTAEVT